jgi:hypothetical protein
LTLTRLPFALVLPSWPLSGLSSMRVSPRHNTDTLERGIFTQKPFLL